MKNKITFTSKFLRSFNTIIFITRINDNWCKEWEILTDKEGEPFSDLKDAIEFVRSEKMGWGIGLSNFEQASRMENAQWDNL